MNFRTSLRAALLCGAASLSGMVSAQTADPEVPSPEQPTMQVTAPNTAEVVQSDDMDGSPAEVVVTGSRIARADLSSSSPLAVVSAEEFSLSGTMNVEQLINTLPQVIPGATAFSNNPGGGVATLDLRGLGNQRTLVLVNGRRYIFFDTTQTVDLNNIPQFLIAGVDVVTGGASAVYGSDAIAGVVNFRMRTDLQGLEIGGQYAITGKGDAQRWDAHAAFGTEFADGRGHLTTYIDYFKRKALLADARDYTDTIYVENATDTGYVRGGNATVPGGRFAVGSSVSVPGGNGLPAVSMPLGAGNFLGLGSLYTSAGVSRPYVAPDDGYNFAVDNFLQVPQRRWLIGGMADYEINSSINAYLEATFANNLVENELAPTPVTGNFLVATNNPFVSAADRASLQQIDANEAAIDAARVARGLAPLYNNPGFVTVGVSRRVNDVGSRNTSFERNAWHAVGGVRGSLGHGLTYDAYYLYTRSRNSNVQHGNVSRSAFANGLVTNKLNIFGPNTLTKADVDSISITTQNTIISELQVANASVSGNLFNLGLGGEDLGFAVGAEWRDMASEVIPDEALSSGDVIGFNGAQPTKGSYSVKEIFGELLVPIIADVPFVDELTVRGAARYSDYALSNVNGVLNWAAGVEWAPVRDLRFRAQFQKASRAPNVAELYGGQFQNFPSAIDPCGSRSSTSSRTQAVRDLCIASGVPASAVFTAGVQPNSQIESLGGGNPDLKEESSKTVTLGLVAKPRFIPGLNVTLDYFKIEVEDYITGLAGGTQGILNACYYSVQDLTSQVCKAINRDPISGAIGGQYLVRALNANISTLKTAGVDLQIDYMKNVDFGLLSDRSKLSLFFLGSWVTKSDYTAMNELPDNVIHCAGTFGTTCSAVFGDPVPEFRFTSRLSWADGPLTTSIRLRHIGESENDKIANGIADASTITLDRLKAKNYVDLTLAYDLTDKISLTAGMNNVFNVKPQIIDDDNDEQSSTYPSTYNPLGRDFFISASVSF
jgi:outer membrane receptor protein involved in Fe transport